MIRALVLAGALLLSMIGVAQADCPAGRPTPPGGCNISDLSPVLTPLLTDQTVWCQPTVAGCKSTDPVVTSKQITFGTMIGFIRTQIQVSPPLFNSGGVIGLGFDSTLSIVNNQLHVVSGGGGGITQLTNDVLAGPGSALVAATVTGLQGRPLSVTAPTTGQCLGWNGSTWLPVACGTGGGGGITSLSAGAGISLSPNPITSTGTVSAGGVTTNITVASACTGVGCTPATSCQTFTAGVLTAFSAGACSAVAANRMLIQTGSAFLIQTGSNLLIQ